MKKLAKILALMLVLTMGVCVFTACDSKVDLDEPEKTVDSEEEAIISVVEDYIDAIIDAEFDEAAELVGNDETKAGMEKMQEMIDEDPEAKEEYLDSMESLEYEIKDVKVDGDEATVKVEVTNDDKSKTGEFELEKIDGDWKIVEVN